ncbi:transcription-repair coupling factor [Helicobacter pylori]|jgi:transcription-repair coupling factor (mfd)|uniref:Transcription-repair-coupling factor n=2 Tax=Helicobacter pylori TaxID=210 RepID=MFD_HELPY|nr:transcription-repair coupling factor [Helicobacter pylori]O26066.1 RecName: Full=Transcription-repair-coupling factor; Short=TRCF [Helicobacter pylori 26695]AAD08581.1 transcription-repair coupling factor (trcF) [Helicobacter pylori 26695]AFV42764.1 transcription-repair coupling factor [Helicobacter pylori 26695]AFV44361.1 transcription-repair coupling factor [Helicobacter pylori Rif1]AFV45951.1 transcription-repair coupling factor [Helicobacter pylori Rif2]AJF09741.1 transcription-repair 
MIQSSLYRALNKGFDYQILACKDFKESELAKEVISYFKPNTKAILFPEFRAKKNDDLRSFFEEFLQLLGGLREFYQALENKQETIIIAPISALLHPLPKKELLESFKITLLEKYNLKDLKDKLFYYGYEILDLVEVEGEASFRGDIVDIYAPNSKAYRLSFFDTECESIKEFDPITQMSLKEDLLEIEIPPTLFSLDESSYKDLKTKVEQSPLNSFSKDLTSFGLWFLGEKAQDLLIVYKSIISPRALEEIQELASLNELDCERFKFLKVLENAQGYEDLEIHAHALEGFIALHSNHKITLLAPNKTILDNAISALDAGNMECVIAPFVLNFKTPDGIFISLNSFERKKKRQKSKLALNELNPGEWVVHDDYGVGVFSQLVQHSVLGSKRDFLEIAYLGEDKLLLPVENLHLIARYVAQSDSVPAKDRLGKGSFLKLKAKVRTKLLEIASKIIELAAERNLILGKKMDVHLAELEVFKSHAGFEYTSDQEKAIAEISKDLSSHRVMDRLLSGDVGFGKTEVAMHAIFCAFLNGFQSALVVPTTLLAHQHFETLRARFENFGVKVARLDRYASEKNKLLKAVELGQVDALIGTHAILGAKFKNLGLVVVDEEHKFGVKQKEALKELSKSVHFLSMSATPIPRTLNMALSQIKGISSLKTPPTDRKPSRTFLKEKNDELLKEIIYRELRRNGQIFYIHNHIASILKVKTKLEDLIPKLKIAILHSQINANESEEIMLEFAKGNYQVLLCTSIVESGIHLPNANTIIIDNAQNFGLADLHQLRGRVGRGKKEGFCYFLIEDQKSLNEQALKRLLALEKNSYLGSGESVAYHDLEIRGGGNLLGQDQSGHIKNIGYALYTRMLEDAIYELSGGKKRLEKSVEIQLGVSAFLNPELIASDSLRLDLYRRLSLCENTDEVGQIHEEIEDRFGKIDDLSAQFLQIITLKILANQLGIIKLSNFNQNITITYSDEKKESLKAPSKDDNDILETLLKHLRAQISLKRR